MSALNPTNAVKVNAVIHARHNDTKKTTMRSVFYSSKDHKGEYYIMKHNASKNIFKTN